MQNNHTQNCKGSGCWLQRIVRSHGHGLNNLDNRINGINNLLLACVICCLCACESRCYGNQSVELNSPVASKIIGDCVGCVPQIGNLVLVEIRECIGWMMPVCCLRSELNQESAKITPPGRSRIVRRLLPQPHVSLPLAVFGQIMTGDSNSKPSDNAGSDVTDNLTEIYGHILSGVAGAITYIIAMRVMRPNVQSSGTRDQPA
jgi:hypothetical protein